MEINQSKEEVVYNRCKNKDLSEKKSRIIKQNYKETIIRQS